ncbi:MAG: VPLPA-CTERM sorting domain-containing protein [Methylococcales bacterium]|nr:VPLPA-CTERM sorting domain-containing protein [Methylococcales bacterium]
MKKLLTALSFLSLGGMQMAQADTLGNYDVTLTFYEPSYAVSGVGYSNSVFTGSFVYDFTTSSITSLTGTLSEAMTGCDSAALGCSPIVPQNLLTLTYMPVASSSDGNGGVIASTFLLNTTTIYQTGSYDTSALIKNASIANAYATIDVSAAQLNGTNPNLASSSFSNLFYGDCTPGGMMGTACMTGWGTSSGAGSMGGYPISEVVTAVPVPAAFWLFGSAMAGFAGINRRKAMRQAA